MSEFVERKCWTKAFKNPIISFTRDLLVFITVGSDGNPFFIIEIIVYRKECDWCYWWQDTASDDHRSCCFNGSVSDENKKQLDPFFDADRVRI